MKPHEIFIGGASAALIGVGILSACEMDINHDQRVDTCVTTAGQEVLDCETPVGEKLSNTLHEDVVENLVLGIISSTLGSIGIFYTADTISRRREAEKTAVRTPVVYRPPTQPPKLY